MSLTYEELRTGVAGEAVGIRCRTALEPLGGPADKVFPPTYSPPDGASTKYAVERRLVPLADGGVGQPADSVVLDSVASQANRLELALLAAIRDGRLAVATTAVDFRPFPDLVGLDRISDYEAPHRIFDALLRDSFDGEHLFRNGPTGRAITEARSRDAAALYHHSPHTLVFGGWDSTGPRGGLGAKYERAITAEIVALDVALGRKTASRIDPAGIQRQGITLYEAPDGTWTLNPDEAVQKNGSPVQLGNDKARDRGRPSQANHGNVTPSVERDPYRLSGQGAGGGSGEPVAGGITARSIVGTTVLSLIQLRRLRFPTLPDGSPIEESRRGEAEVAARTALAALGLAAAVLAVEEGFDLRSRCVLVARGPLAFEVVARDGGAYQFETTGADACKLAAESAERAAAAGLAWRPGELLLRPSDRLVELIRRSRELTVRGDEDGA